MSTYNDIRAALYAAVQAYDADLNIYGYVPRTLTPPAAIVKPRSSGTISYLQAQSSSLAQWRFGVLLVIGLVDEESAQEMAGDLISPNSTLIQNLQNAALPNGFVTVTDGAINEMMVGQALYTYAEISLVVTS